MITIRRDPYDGECYVDFYQPGDDQSLDSANHVYFGDGIAGIEINISYAFPNNVPVSYVKLMRII